ncbi:FHA domain-containing protein [Herbiconiux sp. SYSU D00978]|uniref:FHA domain-containing protein n=1 Tax=Herbiconiux sp. SYSU D00978 TaxID=2812562 RepID=UPI001A96EBB4|nr:FHA domain-containing protein [Herbiconiux sp. SYSU D00978]
MATCAHCDAQLKPNSMFCLECGQVAGIVPVLPPSGPVASGAVASGTAAVLEAPVPAAVAAAPGVQAVEPAEVAAPLPAASPGSRRAAASAPVREVPLAPAAPTETLRRADVPPPAPQVYALPTPAAAANAPRRVTLIFSTGDRAVVTDRAVIGRSPQGSARNSGAQAIELQDASRSVSRVHLYVTVSAGSVTVSDAGSGNGSALERAGVKTALREGRPLTVQPGDRIWLGDVHAELDFS